MKIMTPSFHFSPTIIKTAKTWVRTSMGTLLLLLVGSSSIFAQDNKISVDNKNGQEAVLINADSLQGGNILLNGIDSNYISLATWKGIGSILELGSNEDALARLSAGFVGSGGNLLLGDSSGITVNIEADDGIGSATYSGPNSPNIRLASRDSFADFGKISVLNDQGKSRVDILSYSNAGAIELLDTFGVTSAELIGYTDTSAGDGYGVLNLFSADNLKVELSGENEFGQAKYYGPTSTNVTLGPALDFGEFKEFGSIKVYNAQSRATVEIESYEESGLISVYDTSDTQISSLGGFVDTAGIGYGRMSLLYEFGDKVFLSAREGIGHAEYSGPNSTNITLGAQSDTGEGKDSGKISLYNAQGKPLAEIESLGNNGSFILQDTFGSITAQLGASTDTSGFGHGFFILAEENGPKIFMETQEEVGTALYYGPSSINVTLGGVSNFGTDVDKDWGKISLLNEDNKSTVDIKSFNEYGEINFLDTFGVVSASLGGLSDLSTGHGFGFLQLKSNDGSNALYAGDDDGNGELFIYSDSTSSPDNIAVSIFADDSRNGNGRIRLFEKGDAANHKASLTVTSQNFGGGFFYGPDDSENILIDAVFGNPNNGFFSVHDDAGNYSAYMYSNTFVGGAGVVATNGPNGSLNTFTGPPIGLDNNGAYAVFDTSSTLKGEMFITADQDGIVQSDIIRTLDQKASMFTNGSNQGVVMADVKCFTMSHPLLADKRIVYACIEGPEAAAYARGTAQLQNGRATIQLPDHFRLLAAEEGMTVILTPISIQSKGLAIVRKSLDGIEVGEMFEGKGNYEFDWEVKSIRKGYENYEVIRDNDKPHLKKYSNEYRAQEGEGISSKE